MPCKAVSLKDQQTDRLLFDRFKSKKRAFTNYAKKYSDGKKGIEAELEQLKKHCSVIRVLAHTQILAIGYGQKKAHMSEIQASLHTTGPCMARPCPLCCLDARRLAHRQRILPGLGF